MRIHFEEVPLDVRRRAARAVATLMGDRLSPTRLRKAEPAFGEAVPVYRPNLDDIAYWEIEITGLSTALPAREGEADRAEQGSSLSRPVVTTFPCRTSASILRRRADSSTSSAASTAWSSSMRSATPDSMTMANWSATSAPCLPS